MEFMFKTHYENVVNSTAQLLLEKQLLITAIIYQISQRMEHLVLLQMNMDECPEVFNGST